ncbi:DUF421 domain-containing protein [Paenibacillus xerothermodurans]|uniref:DUF421 domain-containing protein n=1 Tax=Paenibacillus xerothermodurans TaxID=1977292 RepID=A0A2W1NGH0_PAEXE|nr:DUF421 domain-containing protein [Paenibacillus xerothermodurans]PZE22780.1 DUF421 domain-containing protein [Paenibacillus xerothermodurans]
MDYYYITVKLVTAMLGLWLITRVLGKKEISQLTAFDFVSSLMLSEIVGETLYDKEVSLTQLLYALIVWAGLSLLLEKLVQLIPGLSKFLNGSADLIIVNGNIDVKAMKRNHLDFEQLHTLLREQNIFSVREVAFAVFETNGNISVKKKSSDESVTRRDLALAAEPDELPVVLIENGRLIHQRLTDIGRSEDWLLSELREAGARSSEEVVYAEWTDSKGLFMQLRHER